MIVKFCVILDDPFVPDADDEGCRAICEELHRHDLGMVDVPELGGRECWVFELDVSNEFGSSIAEWIKTVLSCIESNIRRLGDQEWIVLVDRASVWQKGGDRP
jgi:hypothetical protein